MKVFGGERSPPPAALSPCQMPVEHLDLAFRYALSQPLVACAVIGMATHAELKDNLRRARGFSPLTMPESRRLQQPGQVLAREWVDHFGPAA